MANSPSRTVLVRPNPLLPSPVHQFQQVPPKMNRTNKCAITNNGFGFVDAIIVTGNGSSPDICTFTYCCVTKISQMIDENLCQDTFFSSQQSYLFSRLEPSLHLVVSVHTVRLAVFTRDVSIIKASMTAPSAIRQFCNTYSPICTLLPRTTSPSKTQFTSINTSLPTVKDPDIEAI